MGKKSFSAEEVKLDAAGGSRPAWRISSRSRSQPL
jgi:hypothetical protein